MENIERLSVSFEDFTIINRNFEMNNQNAEAYQSYKNQIEAEYGMELEDTLFDVYDEYFENDEV
ncbi:hypothetical protein [Ekhidna sp.]